MMKIDYSQILPELFIKKFKNEVDFFKISWSQKLSEGFIKEFQNKIDWREISCNQKLSEGFIRKFQNKVDWIRISWQQKLSEKFILEFQNKVNWHVISYAQILSEEFIREFQNKVDWCEISYYQILSKKFIKEFQDKINVEIQMKKHHIKKTQDQKIKEIKAYVKEFNLEFDGEFLYAFRKNDQFGRGTYTRTIFYEKGKYYQDWRCDLDENEQNSFGLGIFSEGNTKVKVKVEDWGCRVLNSNKARVWGFEII